MPLAFFVIENVLTKEATLQPAGPLATVHIMQGCLVGNDDVQRYPKVEAVASF
jgi:hypothetical protein